jgi:prophage antirepressor-like protein
MFVTAMDRLAEIYANEPAKLEAMNLTKEIALESFGDVGGLSGNIGTETVSSKRSRPQTYSNAPGLSSMQSPKPNARSLAGAMTLIRKWAKSDPVGCQKWVNDTLLKDIENTASTKFGNLSDDWKKAFDDEVSGAADKQREKLAADLAAKKEKDDRKAGEKFAKDQEKAFWDKQKAMQKADKHQAHVDALNKMDAEDAEYEKKRADIQKNGGDPEMYGDTKKRGMFNKLGRGLKRMWHSLHEAAEQAIKDGDMAKLESIKAQMLEMKSLFEAAGVDFDAVIIG